MKFAYTFVDDPIKPYWDQKPIITFWKNRLGHIGWINHSHCQVPISEFPNDDTEWYGIQYREWKYWFNRFQEDQNLWNFQTNNQIIPSINVRGSSLAFGRLYDTFNTNILPTWERASQGLYGALETLANIEQRRKLGVFNLYTSHGRPVMSGISSLPKTERGILESKNGVLVDIDFSGYVFQLLAKKIGYKFSEYPYDELGIEKSEVFYYLFGDGNHTHPFFQKLVPLKEKFADGNSVSLPNGKICTTFHNFTTNLETAVNLRLAKKIDEIFPDSVVFYLYDSFILDLTLEQAKQIDKLKPILPFPAKLQIGRNWGDMKIWKKFVV